MRITILSLGSRGDVQPFITLAVGLQETGHHQVRLAAPDNFEPLAKEYDLDFSPLGMDAQKMLGTGGIDPGRNILLWFGDVLRSLKPLVERMAENSWLACQDADLILYSTLGIAGYHIAEKLGIPCIFASPMPGFFPTRAYPNPGGVFPALPLGGGYNNLTHRLSLQLFQLFTGPMINRWRKEKLQLPPVPFGRYPYFQMGGHPQTIIGNYSPIISPKPADWGNNIHLTGYWFLDPAPKWQPPASLVDFLDRGTQPVYIGFGSMSNRDPRKMAQLAMEALRLSGQRGILAAGWGGLEKADLPDSIFAVDSIPHTWLFPLMAAVIHHGGAGTTAAGLRAGVPSILVPYMGDQHFWGERVTELGVGPPSIPRRKLTAGKLAAAIRTAITDPNMRERAADLGERIRAEDGVARMIGIIEGFSH